MIIHLKLFFLIALFSLVYVSLSAKGQAFTEREYRPMEMRGDEGGGMYEAPQLYNPSYYYYPEYDQNSPEYEQQQSDPQAATFPYHPV